MLHTCYGTEVYNYSNRRYLVISYPYKFRHTLHDRQCLSQYGTGTDIHVIKMQAKTRHEMRRSAYVKCSTSEHKVQTINPNGEVKMVWKHNEERMPIKSYKDAMTGKSVRGRKDS